MAKRRNLKKEKAQRNQAYARQFRRKSSQTMGKGNRQYRSRRDESENAEEKEDNTA